MSWTVTSDRFRLPRGATLTTEDAERLRLDVAGLIAARVLTGPPPPTPEPPTPPAAVLRPLRAAEAASVAGADL